MDAAQTASRARPFGWRVVIAVASAMIGIGCRRDGPVEPGTRVLECELDKLTLAGSASTRDSLRLVMNCIASPPSPPSLGPGVPVDTVLRRP